MPKVLILYSTTDGQTLKICQRIRAVIEEHSQRVDLAAIADDPEKDIGPYDMIVIGASIRYGKHNPEVAKFIESNQAALDATPNAFFSVNAVARKPEKRQPDTNPYMKIFLKKISWRPKTMAVFAGKIDYPKYGLFDRNIIRLIMWMTKGPTDPKSSVEFTDWEQVEAFAQTLTGEI